MIKDKNFALVLGGGSARGLIHAGVLQWFEENNVKPKVIAGTSMGAIIGAFYASGMTFKEIEKILVAFRVRKFLDIDLLSKGGFIRGEKFQTFLENIFGNLKFEDLDTQLKINATDFNTGEEVVFTKGKIVPAIRASMNLPVIFLPYCYKSRMLVDGGVINNLPINQVIHHKVRDIVIINPYYVGDWHNQNKKHSQRLWDVMERTVKLYTMSRYQKELKSLSHKIYIQYDNSKIAVYDFHKSKQIIHDGYDLAKKNIKFYK